MRYAIQAPTCPCPRGLIQTDDDADGLELALQVAREWGRGKLVLVVNGSGRDLGGYAARGHRFGVLLDEHDRPTRSLGEIAEAFRGLDSEAVGCVVVADTNRIYRATRCAVRDARRISDLTPGDWDQTNESLGSACEALSRAAIPSLFVAPSTDERALDADGQEVIVGKAPQAWKDLRRMAHVQLHARVGARGLEVGIISDDFAALGEPGEVVAACSVASGLAKLAKDTRPSVGSTTLEESTAGELAARRRRELELVEQSARKRDRIVGLALLRAHQGARELARLELDLQEGGMLTADADKAAKAIASARSALGTVSGQPTVSWIDWLDDTIERSTASLRSFGPVIGPDPSLCPAEPHSCAGLLQGLDPELGVATLNDATLMGAIKWLAQRLELWSEPRFAAVCMVAGLAPQGRDWEVYPRHRLDQLAVWLLALASSAVAHGELRLDRPEVHVAPEFDTAELPPGYRVDRPAADGSWFSYAPDGTELADCSSEAVAIAEAWSHHKDPAKYWHHDEDDSYEDAVVEDAVVEANGDGFREPALVSAGLHTWPGRLAVSDALDVFEPAPRRLVPRSLEPERAVMTTRREGAATALPGLAERAAASR